MVTIKFDDKPFLMLMTEQNFWHNHTLIDRNSEE